MRPEIPKKGVPVKTSIYISFSGAQNLLHGILANSQFILSFFYFFLSVFTELEKPPTITKRDQNGSFRVNVSEQGLNQASW